MTVILLTIADYEVINTGDRSEILALFKEIQHAALLVQKALKLEGIEIWYLTVTTAEYEEVATTGTLDEIKLTLNRMRQGLENARIAYAAILSRDLIASGRASPTN